MMPRIFFTLLLIFTVHSIQLSAQENLFELSTPASVNEDYFFDYDTIVSRSITIKKNYNLGFFKDYTIGFSSGSSGDPENRRLYSSGGSSLSYKIVDSISSGNILKDIGDNPQAEELLKGTFSSTAPETETFDVVLSGGEFPPPGYYSDSVMLRAYIWSSWNVASSIMDISVTVPTFVNLSLTEFGGLIHCRIKIIFS